MQRSESANNQKVDLKEEEIDKGGKRGKNVSAYAIADDLKIMEKRERKKKENRSWSGWMDSRDVANAEHNIRGDEMI